MSSKKAEQTLSLALLMRQLAHEPQLKHLLVAYSGGVDSHVLLDLLASRRDQFSHYTLSAVHINHGLQAEADHWQSHCERVCRDLKINFQAIPVNAQARPGESPEAAARNARYQALTNLVKLDTALLTGHHRDDQAETLLLQLLRGAGPAGLAAMPVAKAFADGCLIRPLLAFNRQQILAYAGQQQLHWIEDPSNREDQFERNYLRHEVLPRLINRWPGALKTLTRSAELCAETVELCDEIGDDDIISITDNHCRIIIPELLSLSIPRRNNALRRWLQRQQLNLPSQAQLSKICNEISTAAADRQPLLHWSGGEIRRYQNRLYAMPPLSAHDAGQIIAWSGQIPLSIPGIGTLKLVQATAQPYALQTRLLKQLTIRFRQGGEILRLAGQQHRRSLKKLLHEAGIPPWQRDRIPLLYSDDNLAAVAGLGIEASFAVPACNEKDNAEEAKSVVLQWQKSV